MSKQTTYIHAENNNKILSSNEVKLYVPPEPEKMKVIIWGKELCNGAEWYDFLKCVEEKTRENDQLKQQLVEKDKEIKKLNWQLKDKDFIIKNLNHSLSVAPNANAGQRARIDELTKIVEEKNKEIEKLKQQNTLLENENGKLAKELIVKNYKKAKKEVSFGKQLAIQELEKVKASADKWFESWENSKYEGNRYDKLDVSNAYLQMSCEIDQQIKELKGEKDETQNK